MCAVVGTVGRNWCLLQVSFALLFLVLVAVVLVSLVSEAGRTDCLTGESSEPLSREGFDDEYLLRWVALKVREMVAAVAPRGRLERRGDWGAVATTRRTEEGSMAAARV